MARNYPSVSKKAKTDPSRPRQQNSALEWSRELHLWENAQVWNKWWEENKRHQDTPHTWKIIIEPGRMCSSPVPHKRGVALTGRNRTGPPWSVGRPTARSPGGRPACRQCYSRQTTTTDASIRRVSNKRRANGISTVQTLHTPWSNRTQTLNDPHLQHQDLRQQNLNWQSRATVRKEGRDSYNTCVFKVVWQKTSSPTCYCLRLWMDSPDVDSHLF